MAMRIELNVNGTSEFVEMIQERQRQAYVDAPWLLTQLAGISGANLDYLEQKFAGHGMNFAAAHERMMRPHDTHPMAPQSASSFQDPIAYAALREIYLRVEALASARGDRLETLPMLGTLPTGLVNAQALRSPLTGDTAIVFDDEIRVFAYLFSKIVANEIAVPAVDEEYARVDLNRVAAFDPEGASSKWFTAMLNNYFRRGWIRTLPSWTVAPSILRIATTLCDGFELFVMGHEFGHLSRGHFQGKYDPVLDRAVGLNGHTIARGQEIEADAFGLTMACENAVQEFGTPLAGFWGAYLGCKAFEVIDRATYIVAKRGDWRGAEGAVLDWLNRRSDHPPARARSAGLCAMVSRTPFRAAAVEYADAIDRLVDRLFEAAERRLTSHESVNLGVHPRFRTAVNAFFDAPGRHSPPAI